MQIFFEYAAAALSRIFQNFLKNPPKASFQTGPSMNQRISESTICGRWLAWASMEIPAWFSIFSRVYSDMA